MPALTDCLDAATLERFLLGRLTPDERDLVEEHFSRCEACCHAVESVLTNDPLAHAVRSLAGGQDRAEDLLVREVVERVLAMHAAATQSAASGETPAPGAPCPPPAADLVATQEKDPKVPTPVEEGCTELLAPREGAGEIGWFGSYRVLKTLGRGGMGLVYEAEDSQLQRRFALKLMTPDLAANASFRKRFLREARAAASIHHDHLVPIYQVGEERGIPFLAMQLLRGESLEDRLQRERVLPPAEAARIGREIALGLAAAHERGMVHRDVKPANVWLEEGTGRVKLLDFGLARVAGADAEGLTAAGSFAGTPGYAAPEQAEDGLVDGRADLFSLGVVLYRMAVGKLPYSGKNMVEFLKALMREEPPTARQANPATPQALSGLITPLLAKDPARRPGSAAAVAAELADLQGQLRTTAAVSEPRRPRSPLLVAAGLAFLFFVLLAGAAIIIIRDKDGKTVKEITLEKDQTVVIQPLLDVPHPVNPEPSPPVAKVPGAPAVVATPSPAPDHSKQVFRFGAPMSPHALVQRPALLPGVRSWTLETVRNRGAGAPPGLSDDARPVSLAPDGRQVAVVGADWTLRIYDVATGKLQKALLHPSAEPQHGYWTRGCAWSPDGKQLLCHSRFVWDTTSGKLCFEVPGQGRVLACWAPDGKQLATIDDGGLTLWEASTGRKIHENHAFRQYPWCFAWSGRKDGIAISFDKQITIWDVDSPTPKPLRSWEAPSNPMQLVWSPDGRVLAGICDISKLTPLQLWDPDTGKPLPPGGKPLEWAIAGAFSPDGKSLAVARRECIDLCDSASGAPSRRIPYDGFYQLVGSLSWSADGKKLACLHDILCGARVIEVASGESLFEVQSHPACLFCRWSPDGQTIATVECTYKDPRRHFSTNQLHSLRTWDLHTGRASPPLEDVSRAAYSPDGRSLAVISPDDGQVAIHECRTLARQKVFPQPLGRNVGQQELWWSGDGKTLAAGHEKTVRLWDVPTEKVLRDLTLQHPHHECCGLAGSPDGEVLAVAVADPNGIELWPIGARNAQADAPRFVSLFQYPPQELLWSRDGTALACMGRIDWPLILDPKGKVLRTLFECGSIGWSDAALLRALAHNGELKQWEGEDATALARLQPATENRNCRFSADARYVALQLGPVNLESSPLWLRKAGNGEPTAVLVPLAGNRWLAVSPDGHYLASDGVAEELVYVVENDDGHQETLLPAEFARRFHWKNDPTRVRPRGDDKDSYDIESFPPPPGAVVLCDGSSLHAWRDGHGATLSGDGVLTAGKDDLESKEKFDGRFRLHLEFRLPPRTDPITPGPARSGLLVQGRYQLPLADSFGLAPDISSCGAIAGVKAPAQRACRPAGAWQSLELEFESPVHQGDQITQHARMSVWLNDFLLHDKVGVTPTARAYDDKVTEPGPVAIMGGEAGIQFRNVWLLRLPATGK